MLLPGAALAWPVDLRVDVEAGRERFHRLAAVDWVEVEDPEVASAELLPGSGELLLSGRRPGHTRVLLYAEGRFAVWWLHVRAPGERPRSGEPGPQLAAARAACPGLEAGQGEEPLLRARVEDAPCREALLALLRTDAFLARELELTLGLGVLQAQLAQLAPGLAALGLTASYRGAGLVLAGRATPAAHRRALWLLFDGSLGRVALEDRVQELAPGPDAGAGDLQAGAKALPAGAGPLIEIVPAPKPARSKRHR